MLSILVIQLATATRSKEPWNSRGLMLKSSLNLLFDGVVSRVELVLDCPSPNRVNASRSTLVISCIALLSGVFKSIVGYEPSTQNRSNTANVT